jgi:hypothetical protein
VRSHQHPEMQTMQARTRTWCEEGGRGIWPAAVSDMPLPRICGVDGCVRDACRYHCRAHICIPICIYDMHFHSGTLFQCATSSTFNC